MAGQAVYLDTSGLLAVLNADDRYHSQALAAWAQWAAEGAVVFTSNYVILETTALVQRRMGMEVVATLHAEILPVAQVLWVDSALHQDGVIAMLTARQRGLSLVDCTSFEIMRRWGLRTVFAFDRHFAEQGFDCRP